MISRRFFSVFLGLTAVAGVLVAGFPAAADYPEKPVQIIVPFGAGDALDGTARVIAERLKSKLGVPFIVTAQDADWREVLDWVSGWQVL